MTHADSLKIALPVEIIDGPELTGCQYYALHLARELARRDGLELTLIASDKTPLAPLPGEVRVVVHKPRRIMGTAFFDSLVHPPPGLDRFDLIHCPSVIAPFFFKPRAKVVMTVHDLVPLSHSRFSPFRRRLYFRHVVGRRLWGADRVVAVSQATKRDIMGIYGLPGDRIAVIPEGVDRTFRPGPGPKEDFVLSVATLEPRKNLAGVIAAFGALKKALGGATRLYLVGRMGWLRDGALPIPDRYRDDVVFTGWVSRERLIGLYQKARALIYPSFYEGFGLPVLEAMACGCPVITSDRGALGEVGGGACLYADPHSVDQMRDRLIEVLADPGVAEGLVEAGLERAALFSWEDCGQRTAAVYRETLGLEPARERG